MRAWWSAGSTVAVPRPARHLAQRGTGPRRRHARTASASFPIVRAAPCGRTDGGMANSDTSAGDLRLPDRPAALAALERLLLDSWRGFDRRARASRRCPRTCASASAGRCRARGWTQSRAWRSRARCSTPRSPSRGRGSWPTSAPAAWRSACSATRSWPATTSTSPCPSGGADLLEREVVAWVGEFVGFGDGTRGVTTSGGTIANLTALTAARERAAPGVRQTGMAGRRLALYCSARRRTTRSSARRRCSDSAAMPCARSPRAPAGPWTPAACAAAIDARRRRGHHADGGRRHRGHDADRRGRSARRPSPTCAPSAACGCTSTAPTGCPRRGRRRRRRSSPGWTARTPRPSTRTSGCSCRRRARVLLVRDPRALRAAFAHDEAYIPHVEEEEPHAVDQTLEYSRPLRSLKLWLAFTVHGADAIRAAIARNLAHARLLAELVEADDELELVSAPILSAVTLPPPRRPEPRARQRDPAGRPCLPRGRERRRRRLPARLLRELPDDRGGRARDHRGRQGRGADARGLTSRAWWPRGAAGGRCGGRHGASTRAPRSSGASAAAGSTSRGRRSGR